MKKEKDQSNNPKIVSAYSPEGQKRTEKQGLSKGFRALVIIIYVIGFFAAMAIIILLARYCS